jgi:outer membrane lipoprotein-sorting protein
MNEILNNETEALLDRHIEAARQLDEAALAAAARQFRTSLPEAKLRRRGLASWLRVAGAVAVLVLAVSLIPLLVPGKPGASAFAQAQAWFEHYGTLRFEMTTRQNGQVLTTVRVWSDEAGNTRIETPPVIQLVLPSENVLHTVLPGGQVMSQALGPLPGSFNRGSGMEWLDELVEFQGLAEPLDTRRVIDGVDALGWRLELPGGTHTLWVDPADNRPLRLEADLAGDVRMESVFTFDEPLSPTLFELPEGSASP